MALRVRHLPSFIFLLKSCSQQPIVAYERLSSNLRRRFFVSVVLVIEDNNELQHYLVTVLRSGGHQVYGVSSCAKGLETVAAQNYKIDLLLLDVQVGDGTAFDFLEKVKAENPMFDPKICFVSSRRDADTVKKAVSMGAGDYIVKPVLSGTLLAKVSALLGDKTTQEKFSSASCSFTAVLAGSDAVQPDLLITQVSETNVVMKSSAQLQEGALVPIIVDELQQLLEIESEHLIFRIGRCEKMSWGKYAIEASFVGLPEEKVVKLRSFTIRGSFLGGPNARKPA
jgi:DNA-binding response OmpR family regulator